MGHILHEDLFSGKGHQNQEVSGKGHILHAELVSEKGTA